MDSLPTLLLKPGEADRILAGHPWVYQGTQLRLTHTAEDGSMVQVKDHRQRLLGTGFINSKSKILVRLLSRDRIEPDTAFFEERIRAALETRRRFLPGASSYRLVNAESDFLSGLIVDKYEDVLVLQASSLGMDQRKGLIVEALNRVLKPRAILERNDIGSRKFEGMAEAQGLLAGEFDISPGGRQLIRLNNIKLSVDLAGGHKTGLYLDQQVNYLEVGKLMNRGQVLDCFSFAGGFALHAAAAGAAHVHALDQSADACATAANNAALNGLAARCTFETANVFDWLKSQTSVRANEKLIPRFDGVILDPPSFTRNRASIPDALRGYKEIHLRALKLLKPGGILATFCCSHHVDASMFMNVILEAAFDARRLLRRVAIYSQSPDHPVIPTIPETEYLKGFAFEVVV